MTELFLSLVIQYGVIILFVTTFLSCIALPVPASLVMLAGGGFAANGDLSLAGVLGAAYLGAVLGDQAGFRIGRSGAVWLEKSGWKRNCPHIPNAAHF